MKNPVEINLETLTEQVNVKGMKKKELADFYGIPVTQMTNALKQAGLKIRKFHHPAFVLTTNTASDEVVEEVATTEAGSDTVIGETVEVASEDVATPVAETETPVEERDAEWK